MMEVQLLVPRTTSGCQTPSEGRDLFSDNEAGGEQGQDAGCFEVKSNLGRCLPHIIQKYWTMKLPSSFKDSRFLVLDQEVNLSISPVSFKKCIITSHQAQSSQRILPRTSWSALTLPLPLLGLMRYHSSPRAATPTYQNNHSLGPNQQVLKSRTGGGKNSHSPKHHLVTL